MKIVTFSAIGFALLLSFYFLWETNFDNEGHLNNLENEQPLVFDEPKLFEYKNNKLRWWFKANKALSYDKKKLTQIHNISGKLFFGKKNDHPALIKADFGNFNQKTKIIKLWGNIKIKMDDIYQISTEEIIFDQENEKFYNQKQINVSFNKNSLTASSFNYDFKKKHLYLNDIEMTIKINN